MFYVIPGMCSLDGARSSSIDQQFGRNSTDSTERVEGSDPETNVISLEHRANRAMFQNKPATRASSEWCEFPSGVRSAFRRRTTTGRSSSLAGQSRTRCGRGEGRSSRSWYLCVQNKPAKEETPNVEPRGGVGRGRALRFPHSLSYAVTAKAVRINLIEALSLLDCGSKRKRRPARLKRGTRPKILGTVLTLVHPWGAVSECVVRACVRLANPCPPSRVLKPYPLTLLVGADDRLSGSAAPNSWTRRLLGAVSLFLWPVSISVGAGVPLPLSLGLPFREEIMA